MNSRNQTSIQTLPKQSDRVVWRKSSERSSWLDGRRPVWTLGR